MDYEEVWSLKHELGWAALRKDNKSEKINIYEFIEDWILGLKEDGISITIMWYEGKGIEVKWDAMLFVCMHH